MHNKAACITVIHTCTMHVQVSGVPLLTCMLLTDYIHMYMNYVYIRIIKSTNLPCRSCTSLVIHSHTEYLVGSEDTRHYVELQ